VNSLRIFFRGGYLSYRALFNWITPWSFVPTVLGGPLFVLLFFTYLGRYTRLRDETFFVVGNAVFASTIAGIYGSIMAISNERFFGTLPVLLATPANRLAIFLGRGVPYVLNGILVSAFGFAMSSLLLDFHPPAASLPALAVATAVSVISCTAFGMMLGSIGLRARDVFFIGNSVVYVLLLLCGVNVPTDLLPSSLQAIGRGLPLTHGIAAARKVVAGNSLSSVASLLLTELAIGAAYAAAGYALFRFFEAEGRRRASLEVI
jgi:ABC-2 type transport system permease protein